MVAKMLFIGLLEYYEMLPRLYFVTLVNKSVFCSDLKIRLHDRLQFKNKSGSLYSIDMKCRFVSLTLDLNLPLVLSSVHENRKCMKRLHSIIAIEISSPVINALSRGEMLA